MVLSACETGVGEARPWVQAFVEECSIFPSGKYDDQVDQMSQALNWLCAMASPPRSANAVAAAIL